MRKIREWLANKIAPWTYDQGYYDGYGKGLDDANRWDHNYRTEEPEQPSRI